MCQRVFWSVYCFDKTVSQLRNETNLIRFDDVRIDLPAALDDRLLCAYEELPSETHTTSFIPYLLEVVKYSRLSSEALGKL